MRTPYPLLACALLLLPSLCPGGPTGTAAQVTELCDRLLSLSSLADPADLPTVYEQLLRLASPSIIPSEHLEAMARSDSGSDPDLFSLPGGGASVLMRLRDGMARLESFFNERVPESEKPGLEQKLRERIYGILSERGNHRAKLDRAVARSDAPLIPVKEIQNLWGVELSPSGNRLFTHSRDDIPEVWDLTKMESLGRHPKPMRRLSEAFSPKEEWVAIGNDADTVELIKPGSPQIFRSFRLNFNPREHHYVRSMLFSGDAKNLLVAHQKFINVRQPSRCLVSNIDTASGKITRRVRGSFEENFRILGFRNPDGAIAAKDFSKIWEISPEMNARVLIFDRLNSRSDVRVLGLTEDFQNAFVEVKDEGSLSVFLFDLRWDRYQATNPRMLWKSNLRSRPSPLVAWSSKAPYRVGIYDPQQKELIVRTLDQVIQTQIIKEELSILQMSADGEILVAGTADGQIFGWKSETLEVLFTSRPDGHIVSQITLTPDGSRLIAMSYSSGIAKIIDFGTAIAH
jgi:WD40 repeat protein